MFVIVDCELVVEFFGVCFCDFEFEVMVIGVFCMGYFLLFDVSVFVFELSDLFLVWVLVIFNGGIFGVIMFKEE